MSGRGAICVALPLPDAHLAFWHSLSQDQLCTMGQRLADSGKNDLPDGIDADVAVWGDDPWLHVGGLDLADEVTISLWSGDGQADEDAVSGSLDGLAALFADLQSDRPFARPAGRTFLLYCKYEKAGYFYGLGTIDRFDTSLLSIEVSRFPELISRDAHVEQRLIHSLTYDGAILTGNCDYSYDHGRAALVVGF